MHMKWMKLFGLVTALSFFMVGCSDDETVEADNADSEQRDKAKDEKQKEDKKETAMINIHDFNFNETEADLDQTVFFSNEENDNGDYREASPNYFISEDVFDFTSGAHSILADSEMLVDDKGEGVKLEYPDDLDTNQAPATYANGFYYVGLEEGIFKINEDKRDIEQIAKDPVWLIIEADEDTELIYYITNDDDYDNTVVHAIDSDGKEQWATDPVETGMMGAGMTNVVVADDMLIYKTNDFTKALDKETGEEIWNNDNGYFTVTPAGDSLYALMFTGNGTVGEYTLTELDQETGEELNSLDLPKTFSLTNQDYPEIQSIGDMMFIDLEQSVLGYNMKEKTIDWALTGENGLEADGIEINDDLMDVDVRVSDTGTVAVSGTINHQNGEDLKDFLLTIDPITGEINDGSLIDGEITASLPENKYGSEFIVNPDVEDKSSDERESFLTEIQ